MKIFVWVLAILIVVRIISFVPIFFGIDSYLGAVASIVLTFLLFSFILQLKHHKDWIVRLWLYGGIVSVLVFLPSILVSAQIDSSLLDTLSFINYFLFFFPICYPGC